MKNINVRNRIFILIAGLLLIATFFASRIERSEQGYILSQMKEGTYQSMFQDSFETEYSTKDFEFESYNDSLNLEIVHKGGDFADIESVKAKACNEDLVLKSAIYLDNNFDISQDIIEDDLNVVIAQDMPIRLEWDVPTSCDEAVIVSLNANEYTHAQPLSFSGNRVDPVNYIMDTNLHSVIVDGSLDETDSIDVPLYEPMWRPSTGHPDGKTYVYVSNDDEKVYFSFDITLDNTDELGEDWLELTVKPQKGNVVSFMVTDENDQFGKCGFGFTSKVSYKHQFCEIAIDRDVITSEMFDFSVLYYGTGGAPERSLPIFSENFFDEEYASSMFDTSVFSAHFRDTGGADTTVSNTTFVDKASYAFDTATSSNASFIGFGQDKSDIGNGYLLKVASVNSPGAAANWTVTLTDRSDDFGDYGVSKIIQMIDDNSDGVFVLYLEADTTPGSEGGSVELVHISSGGVISYLDSFPWRNADMIKGSGSSVIVMTDIGVSGDLGGLAHGSVQRYTSAGIDAVFGTVAISSNTTSTKSGAVMIPNASIAGSEYWVLWLDDDGPAGTTPGLYIQRISSAGAVLGSARGDLLLDTDVEGNGFDVSEFLRASVGFGFDSKYVAYMDGNGDWRIVEISSTGGVSSWSCVQNFGPADSLAIAHEEGISGGDRGIYAVGLEGTELRAQLYEQADGTSVWDLNTVTIDTDANLQAVLQNNFYPTGDTVTRTDATAVAADQSNGLDLGYSKGSPKVLVFTNPERSTFPAGAGGDCAGVTAPDAPVILGIAGNEEIQVDFPEPADNGSTITQYEVRYGPKVGFPGNEVTVVVPYVAGAVSYTITGLTNGTEYSVRVFATNAGGLSAASNVVDVTPTSIGNRRRDRAEIGKAAAVYLGNKYAAADEAQEMFNSLFHGAASFGDAFGLGEALGLNAGELSEIVYQSALGGEETRVFSEDQVLLDSLPNTRQNILTLLDLLTQLRSLYAFMQSEDTILLPKYRSLSEGSRLNFMRRNFLHLVGVKYFSFDTEFREDLTKVLDILVDWEKALLIKFGQVCYDESVIKYMTDLDYPDSPNWFHRYKEKSREWVTGVLGEQAAVSPGFVDWLKVDDKIQDPLKAYYQFVFGYCLAEAIES